MTSAVDVVVPCYRYGHLLPHCVRSILSQTGVDVRVLIIDDASGDGSADVARELAAADPRIEAREHTTNMRHIATFNEGVLDWAEAPLTLLISADDELNDGALRRAVDLMDAHPDVAFCYGHARRWDVTKPRPHLRQGAWRPIIYDGHSWLKGRFDAAANPVFSPTVVVRTELQQKVGGYNPKMLHTSDLEMWLKLALHGDVGFISGADQGLYRVHESNMSSDYYDTDMGLKDLQMRALTYEEILTNHGDLLPDGPELDQMYRRRLAKEALLRVGRAYDHGNGTIRATQALEEFALQIYADARRLPEWRTLQLRKAMGPRVAPFFSPLVFTAVGRRLRQRRLDERLINEGV
ncbi:Glycosyl transferase family 2 [Pseudonocardia thermophila]|uniref:Glycosyl transferase family 2 n=1 Tax=Pseudonocardia thermophila TaxID=1848 RepID=A0A1M6YWJ9_PSETH|nr:glycosyltransferase family 2 protein [Pseudonocardia thermophila]SHL22483.1 Glycosyl transferase family 2 [Pseudonocardia thermophila]